MPFRLKVYAPLLCFVLHLGEPSRAPGQGQFPQPASRTDDETGIPRSQNPGSTSQAILGTPVPATEQLTPANPAETNEQPLAPPFPALNADEQRRLSGLLGYWETQSNKVRTFSCQFSRMSYDSVFGPPDKPLWIAQGEIRYASPDKGEFRVERVAKYEAPEKEGGKPEYQWQETEAREHWICDGNSVFELNAAEKQLIERRLPAEMRGKDIADGPLPFIFGATRAKIDARYWVREVPPPPERRGEYCLEAYPKRREDAGSFQRVRLILDASSFLPVAMEVFPPMFDGKNNLSREVYTFKDPQVNTITQRTGQFLHQFISPRVPRGWKKIVQDFDQGGPPDVPQAAQRLQHRAPGPPQNPR
jgi:TIGR03009 family protein